MQMTAYKTHVENDNNEKTTCSEHTHCNISTFDECHSITCNNVNYFTHTANLPRYAFKGNRFQIVCIHLIEALPVVKSFLDRLTLNWHF